MTAVASTPISFEARLVGIERVKANLSALPRALYKEVARVIKRDAILLQARVKNERLSLPAPGPQGLHVVTGTLRRSINVKTNESPGKIEASVGTNVRYGAVWELGFKGTVTVSQHVRRLGQTSRATKKVGQRQRIAFVRAHNRNVDNWARPFLRPVLEDMRPQIRNDIFRAIAGLTLKGPGGNP